MVNCQISLPESVYQNIAAQAAAKGMSIENFIAERCSPKQALASSDINAIVRNRTPEERVKAFKEWVNQPRDIPHANQIDDSREAIYEDRW